MKIGASRITLGVCGSISAYKSVQMAHDLVKAGADVTVIMTESATRFVAPLTFEVLTGKPVLTNMWQNPTGEPEPHISLGRDANLLVIAPASAQTIARLALGLSDDLLSLTALASAAPILIAPAMHYRMWMHPTTAQHVHTLRERGVTVLEPCTGKLASGEVGAGRLPEPDEIVGAIRWRLGRDGKLRGRRVVVTAGGTREALDPVRFLANGSSGQMGYSIAQAAIEEGAEVTLISANVGLAPTWGATLHRVTSAKQMAEVTTSECEAADVLIMAAAVADYRPANASDEKIKKSGEGLTLELEETVDILARIERQGLVKVGFAAETSNLKQNALDKMRRKGVQLQIANDARETIGAPNAQVFLFYPDGRSRELPSMSKEAVAEEIIEAVADLLQ